MGLPSGTVTFLFTDIERSTETVAELGNERYADVLDDQRERLRSAFAAHQGHEVGTEGDAFFIAFVRAHDAVNAAVDGQKALADHVLRVRMGVHTGEAVVRGGDYVGHDVHKAKRICDAGHGGQILLSETTADLVRTTTPVADLGPHRLKDLEEAQRLFQVKCDELPNDFPPLRSLESFRHNLPLQRSAFIGREDDIAQVRKQIEKERLVTLTGVGGCGKTRLALQVGAELLDQFPDGVFFIDLSTVSEPKALTATAAQTLGVKPPASFGVTGQGSAEELLMDFLRTHRCLLILDNCEHLLDESAELVDKMLSVSPTITVLATSREPLDVEGEQAWRVPSLSVAEDATDAQSSEAVSLFKARARAVQPDFELTPTNVRAVAEICARLDGIPLAIEFAAARIGHMSPQQIADRLSDRFHLLTGSRRRVQRQQTLQAALDWSYDLLREDERMLLRRLAVFAGPFRMSDVEGVCTDESLPKRAVTDLLGSLVSKSLVVTERVEDEVRFRLLETVRLYAEDHLVRAGESPAFRGRHRDHFLGWLSQFAWEDIYALSWLSDAVEAELPQLRAAVEWSSAEGDHAIVAEMSARMFPSLYWNLHVIEGQSWLAPALDHVDAPPATMVNWLTSATAYALIGSADISEAMGLATRAVELPLRERERGGGYVFVAGYKLVMDAVVSLVASDTGAQAAVRTSGAELIEVGRSVSGRWHGLACVFVGLAELCFANPEGAMSLLETGLQLLNPDECAEFWLATQASVCAAAIATGDTDKAVVSALRGSEHPLAGRWAMQLDMVAGVAFGLVDEHDRARGLLRSAIDRASGMTVPGWLEEILCAVAAYLVPSNPRAASALLSWIKAQTFDRGYPSRTPIGYTLYRHGVREVRRLLSDADVEAGKARGRAMSHEQVAVFGRAALDG
jgi:predicted ATPase/class 3 adenylate cyclase